MLGFVSGGKDNRVLSYVLLCFMWGLDAVRLLITCGSYNSVIIYKIRRVVSGNRDRVPVVY